MKFRNRVLCSVAAWALLGAVRAFAQTAPTTTIQMQQLQQQIQQLQQQLQSLQVQVNSQAAQQSAHARHALIVARGLNEA